MCYEFWRQQQTREEEAKKRAQEMIEKVRTAPSAPKTTEPATEEKEKDGVPA